MKCLFRGRVCPFAARFSIDEEDEVEVDCITVSFLNVSVDPFPCRWSLSIFAQLTTL